MASLSWTNHNSLLYIATNEIASFCIDNRLLQMVFFHVRQSGQRLNLHVGRFDEYNTIGEYTRMDRHTIGEKCLAQENNTMSLVRARTWTIQSRIDGTNHEATVPPMFIFK